MAFSCFQWIVGGGLRGSFKIPSPSTSLRVGSQSGKFLEILGRCEKTHIVRRIASDAQAGASSWRQDLWVVGFDVAVPNGNMSAGSICIPEAQRPRSRKIASVREETRSMLQRPASCS
jgi:hypothetical protein